MHSRRTRARALAWLAPVAMLAAVVLALRIVRERPFQLAGLVLGVGLVAILAWIVTSVLWPARAERTCPACGRRALERIDPEATHGIVCSACGFRDETASAWLFAEEEGPLEEIVLRERRRRRGRRGARSTVDSRRGAH